jgi:hypothetical protein
MLSFGRTLCLASSLRYSKLLDSMLLGLYHRLHERYCLGQISYLTSCLGCNEFLDNHLFGVYCRWHICYCLG